MPHVEEGQLHAWLDGAYAAGDPELLAIRTHVHDCPDCRNRLDEAQVLRERAGEILGIASPIVVEPPAFEELTARQTNSRARRLRVPGPPRLAWAATVVLALGAGWIAHGLLPLSREAGSAVLQESAESTSASTVAPEAAALSAPAAPQVSDAQVAALPPAPPTAAGFAKQTNRAAKVNAKTADESRKQGGAAMAGAAASQPVARAAADSAFGRFGEQVALQELVVTGVPEERPVSAASRLGTIDGPAPIAWQATTLEQARQRYGTVLHVPDLSVETVATAQSGSNLLVRITQMLPDRSALELLHTIPLEQRKRAEGMSKAAPAASAPGAAAAAAQVQPDESAVSDATGAWLVTVRRGSITITARAPIAPDSIRALIGKLR